MIGSPCGPNSFYFDFAPDSRDPHATNCHGAKESMSRDLHAFPIPPLHTVEIGGQEIFLQGAQKVCRFLQGIFVIGVDVCLLKREEENHNATVCALATQ